MEEFLGRGSGSRSALIHRGIGALIAGMILLAFTTAYTRGVFADSISAKAVIDDAGGSLVSGADVKSRGVIVGRTTGLTLTDHGVEIGLEFDKASAAQIPATVKARVLPATVFGTSYVDLVGSAPGSAPSIRNGQRIAQDRSAGTLELQTTLDNLYRVVTAVHPAELATTLAAISQALKGRGDEIGTSMVRLENYLARLNPQIPLLREDLRLLATNLENLDRHAPQLFAAAEDGLVTVRTIAEKKSELTTLLTGGGALVSEADRFLSAEEQPIIDTIRQSAAVVDAFYDERNGIASGFRSFVRFGRRGATALSDGPWLSTNIHIVTSGGPQYTGADCPRYGAAHGDNCSGGATAGKAASTMPDLDSALVGQLKDKLAQFDGTSGSGLTELLSRPLLGDGGGAP